MSNGTIMDSPDRTGQTRCCDEFDQYQRRQRRYMPNRRDFLKTTVGIMAGAAAAPHMFLDAALAARLPASANTDPILVVIQLAGGNDGLNTIVPYASNLYYQSRPTIGVATKSVLPIDNTVGFNPNLAPLKPFYDQRKLAILQGVGYPNPDRSHFRSTAIWESADPVGNTPTGWLGRYLDVALAHDNNPLKALALGSMVPQTLVSERSPVPSIESVNGFRFLVGRQDAQPILQAYRSMYDGSSKGLPPYIGLVRTVERNADQGAQELQVVAANYTPKVHYPQNPLSRELQLVSQIIASNLGTRVFHVSLNGFDDHVAEVYTHANLMKTLGESLAAFYQDLQSQGKADQVLIMTFSEFGRRVKENDGRGTDHGTAAPLFILGGKVKGGMYGDDPILTNLDTDGDLKYGIDFRSVYGTVLDGWLGADSRSVLGGQFERLPFI
jgi:uncharacterized protein (DUF1501 family)